MSKGTLYVIEGLDGSGKATQAGMLCEYLQQNGQDYTHISFPDYDELSSILAKMYLAGELGSLDEVNPFGASLFYTVDRYASFCKHWKKDYETGRLIIADRYSTSNIPHQMSRLPQEDWDDYLRWLTETEYDRVGLPRPDKVVYLDVEPEVSRRLLSQRYEGDESRRDIHEANFAYLQHCRTAALYGAEKQGWIIIPCTKAGEMQSRQNIQDAVREALEL